MDLGLKGKNIIVTGGTRGIGLAIAEACAREGANVSICGRTAASLAAAVANLQSFNVSVHQAQCDIADPTAIEGYIAAATKALGSIDGLVNNPSGFGNSDDEDGWKKGVDIDLMGVVRCTWAAREGLARSKGAILNVSSISGQGASTGVAYGAVKAAVIQLTMSHAKVMASQGIRVNCVAPGSIEFDGGVWANVKEHMPDMYQSTLASIPFGRMGRPEEVGSVGAFLLSDAARWVTGQTVAVDGAQNL